jgi:hypothetical protein
MAELDEYAAVIDQAIDRLCDEAGISRAVVEAAVEADRAAMAPRWEAERRLAEEVQRRAERWGPAFESAIRAAAQK